jgi:murein L,D-transpeptidase YcbB/YkuD
MKIIPYFLIIFLLLACSESQEEVEKNFLKDKQLSATAKMKRIVTASYLSSLGISENVSSNIIKFYTERGFKTVFATDSTISKKGLKLQEEINQSLYYGIPNQRIKPTRENLHPLEKEALMIANFAVIVNDLNVGFFDFTTKKVKEISAISHQEMRLKIKELDTISVTKLLLKQGPADTNYRFLATHLYNYCKKYSVDTSSFTLKTEKEDSIDVLGRVKKVLISKKYLSEEADSALIIETLKAFQLENGIGADAKLGFNTVKALNESTYDKVLRASLALDKLRSQEKKPSKHVRINLPEFRLYFFSDDTLRSEHRIIIGKVTNQTPELVSNINRITCFPYWRVPYSIASKEILPDLKRNKNYLAKHHYKLYAKEKEVDPTIINWSKYSSFPFQVVQQPGKWNSLGLVKFEFNNSHSVYVHDTPSRGLFNNSFRSYSHGCMRCQYPQELAKTILKYDSIGRKEPITSEVFDSIMKLERNYPIPLKNSVPIFIEYQSVVAYRDRMVFYIDLYNREKELVGKLKGKSEKRKVKSKNEFVETN